MGDLVSSLPVLGRCKAARERQLMRMNDVNIMQNKTLASGVCKVLVQV